ALIEEFVIREIFKKQGLIDNKNLDNKNKKEEKVINNLISNNKGKKALEVIKKYLEQSQFATKNNIYLL
ncbi:24853_t:CDS:1, partial [Cetraspora pellucida]